jgi:protein TonB
VFRGYVVAFFSIFLVYAIPLVVQYFSNQNKKTDDAPHARIVTYSELSAPPPIELKAPPPQIEQPAIQVETVKFLQPVIKPDDQVQDDDVMPTMEDLKDANPGLVTSEGVDSVVIDGGTQVVQGSENGHAEVEIFSVAEIQPQFTGGTEALYKFLNDNLKYPVLAKEMRVSGMVIVQFVVERDGSITDIVVARSIGVGLDEEAVRVIKLMPKWIPGRQGNYPVRVRYTIPVRFTLVD